MLRHRQVNTITNRRQNIQREKTMRNIELLEKETDEGEQQQQ